MRACVWDRKRELEREREREARRREAQRERETTSRHTRTCTRLATDGGDQTQNNYDCQNFRKVFFDSPCITNTFSRESPKFQNGFHVSKWSPHHLNRVSRKTGVTWRSDFFKTDLHRERFQCSVEAYQSVICHTYERITSRMWKRHVMHTNLSRNICGYVVSHIPDWFQWSVEAVTHINQ